MIITFSTLAAFLAEQYPWDRNDTPPTQALAVKFAEDHMTAKDSITYHTVGGEILVLDVDDKGEVIGVEIV